MAARIDDLRPQKDKDAESKRIASVAALVLLFFGWIFKTAILLFFVIFTINLAQSENTNWTMYWWGVAIIWASLSFLKGIWNMYRVAKQVE